MLNKDTQNELPKVEMIKRNVKEHIQECIQEAKIMGREKMTKMTSKPER